MGTSKSVPKKLSPMMRQYLDMKEQHKDCLLLFRLGDFYELFFEDALTASKVLELTLTGRDCGLEERAPMCGVPHHAVNNYILRLLENGFKVAICEQMTDPSESNGLVEREVVRVVTPGTVIEPTQLDEKANNYLVSLCKMGQAIGLAAVDVSTGEFNITQIEPQELLDELVRLAPIEIIGNYNMHAYVAQLEQVAKTLKNPMQPYKEDAYDKENAQDRLLKHFDVTSLAVFGCDEMDAGVSAAGALLAYLNETQKTSMAHINRVKVYRAKDAMVLDASARRNLELTETLRGKTRKGSLLWQMDETSTSMGSRLLRRWIEQPLQDRVEICNRLDAVEELLQNPILREDLMDQLRNVKDIERMASKIAYKTVNPRECLLLRQSFELLPAIKAALQGAKTPLIRYVYGFIDTMDDIYDLLSRAIGDNPPVNSKDGGIINRGYHEELDMLHHVSKHGRELIAGMETAERELTGIRNLKINYNKVFGYYIEVTNSNVDMVPYRYTRRQTIANAERFVTEELKELEGTILGAEERSEKLEHQLFAEIREALYKQIGRVQQTAKTLAQLDVVLSLAQVAQVNEYVKPDITEDGAIRIVDGRHPMVERSLSGERFVPNHTFLDRDENRFSTITGPNMSGKSTYLRQVALIALMAHMGSFVPAREASVCMVDRVFTRIGANDDLFQGQSTFMVEMSELAHILHNATTQSLVVLDEVGRGTSTYDGLSVAWAMVEFIADKTKIGAKTLFATHYHELTELEGLVPGVNNYCISVKEVGDQVLFLRRIVRGGADKSFGVHVAQMAGVPAEMIARAKEILENLEQNDSTQEARPAQKADKVANAQPHPYEAIVQELKAIDMTTTTPIDAFYAINRWKEKLS